MQVERVAQTEPESFQLPSPDALKAPLQQAAKALTVCLSSFNQSLIDIFSGNSPINAHLLLSLALLQLKHSTFSK